MARITSCRKSLAYLQALSCTEVPVMRCSWFKLAAHLAIGSALEASRYAIFVTTRHRPEAAILLGAIF